MASRRSLPYPCKTLINVFQRQQFSRQSNRLIPNFLIQTRTHMSTESLQKSSFESNVSTESLRKSPFESNVLRILRNEIVYQSEYAPPHQPATEFKVISTRLTNM
ncbi:Kinesin-related protein [Actinidia chinensis var. chinensis]|uniref:Kinesin-related protein n=1 Tax=Actinidia chinensis var. chinensis TaxID=1590841 RepID=A0A2R6QMR3_ACTCC|nr:Kinesin-related protein [Actinidia chinensis var. chinensis]